MKNCVVINFSIRHLEISYSFKESKCKIGKLGVLRAFWNNLEPLSRSSGCVLTRSANYDKEQTWSKHGPKLEIETFGGYRFYLK